MKIQMPVLVVASSDSAAGHHSPFCGICEDFLEECSDLGGLRTADHDGDFGLRSGWELETNEVGAGLVSFTDVGDTPVGDDVVAFVWGLDEALCSVDDLVCGAFGGAADNNGVIIVNKTFGVEGCDFPQAALFFQRRVVTARSCGCSVCAGWWRVLTAGLCGGLLWAGGVSLDESYTVFGSSRALYSFSTDQEWVVINGGKFFCVFVAPFNMGCDRGYSEVWVHFRRFESARDRFRQAWLLVSGTAGALQGWTLVGCEVFVVVNSDPLARKRVECTKHVPKFLCSLVGDSRASVFARGRRMCGASDDSWANGRLAHCWSQGGWRHPETTLSWRSASGRMKSQRALTGDLLCPAKDFHHDRFLSLVIVANEGKPFTLMWWDTLVSRLSYRGVWSRWGWGVCGLGRPHTPWWRSGSHFVGVGGV